MKFVAKKLEKTADNSSGSERWRDRLKNLALVTFVLTVLYLILGFVADFSAMRISDEAEGQIFLTQTADEDDSAPPEFGDAKLIFAKLIKNSDLRKLPYHLQYMPEDTPNAFAVPGGGVIVTRGLLEKMTDPTALAFVLGHELGHHQHRHTLKGVGRKALISFTFASLFGSGGVISQAVDLAESQHSQSVETEADDFGFRLAHSVYGDAEGYLKFFKALQNTDSHEYAAWLQFVNSHPPTDARLQHLEKLAEELKISSEKNTH